MVLDVDGDYPNSYSTKMGWQRDHLQPSKNYSGHLRLFTIIKKNVRQTGKVQSIKTTYHSIKACEDHLPWNLIFLKRAAAATMEANCLATFHKKTKMLVVK